MNEEWALRALALPEVPDKMLSIAILGMTQSQLRHRDSILEDVDTKAVFTVHRDPENCKDAKRLVANLMEQILYRDSDYPWNGPVVLRQLTIFPPNSTWYDGKQHTQVPDVDNLVKLIKDSCKGVLWRDDSQVVGIVAAKIWGRATPSSGGTVLELCFYPEHEIQARKRQVLETRREMKQHEQPTVTKRRGRKVRPQEARSTHAGTPDSPDVVLPGG